MRKTNIPGEDSSRVGPPYTVPEKLSTRRRVLRFLIDDQKLSTTATMQGTIYVHKPVRLIFLLSRVNTAYTVPENPFTTPIDGGPT
uniref:Uncharacterized protein n=1 Tax=Steinernema glaseri TaxID=37863 RepID=A0A1I7Z1N8_9BILA